MLLFEDSQTAQDPRGVSNELLLGMDLNATVRLLNNDGGQEVQFGQQTMKLNYKPDGKSSDGEISPGLSAEENTLDLDILLDEIVSDVTQEAMLGLTTDPSMSPLGDLPFEDLPSPMEEQKSVTFEVCNSTGVAADVAASGSCNIVMEPEFSDSEIMIPTIINDNSDNYSVSRSKAGRVRKLTLKGAAVQRAVSNNISKSRKRKHITTEDHQMKSMKIYGRPTTNEATSVIIQPSFSMKINQPIEIQATSTATCPMNIPEEKTIIQTNRRTSTQSSCSDCSEHEANSEFCPSVMYPTIRSSLMTAPISHSPKQKEVMSSSSSYGSPSPKRTHHVSSSLLSAASPKIFCKSPPKTTRCIKELELEPWSSAEGVADCLTNPTSDPNTSPTMSSHSDSLTYSSVGSPPELLIRSSPTFSHSSFEQSSNQSYLSASELPSPTLLVAKPCPPTKTPVAVAMSSSSAQCCIIPSIPTSSPSLLMGVPTVAASDLENSDSDDSDGSEDLSEMGPDEGKRLERRRHNNRVAAQRCRSRKRNQFQGLKREIQDWECQNTRLKYEIHQFQKQLTQLSDMWNQHIKVCNGFTPNQTQTNPTRKHKKHKKHHKKDKLKDRSNKDKTKKHKSKKNKLQTQEAASEASQETALDTAIASLLPL